MACYKVAPIAVNPINGLLVGILHLERCPHAEVTDGEGKGCVVKLDYCMVKLHHQEPRMWGGDDGPPDGVGDGGP